MSTEEPNTERAEALAETRVSIDTSAPAILIGAQIADAVLPLVATVARDGVQPQDCAVFWHGFMAAVTGAMSTQVGLAQSEAIMTACVGYGRRMAAEEAERAKGAH